MEEKKAESLLNKFIEQSNDNLKLYNESKVSENKYELFQSSFINLIKFLNVSLNNHKRDLLKYINRKQKNELLDDEFLMNRYASSDNKVTNNYI